MEAGYHISIYIVILVTIQKLKYETYIGLV